MSVVFLTEAGKEYGVGHMTRCDAIAQALYEQWKKSVFIIDAPQDVTLSLTHKTLSGIKWQNNWPALNKIMTELNLTDKIEGIFVDSYYASRGLLEKLAVFNVPLFFMDDYCRLDYPKGAIINPEISAKESLYYKKSGRTVYAGIQYLPLRSPFWDMEVPPYTKRKGIVVTMGGSGDQRCLNLIMEKLTVNVSEPIILVAPDNQIQCALSPNVTVVSNRQSAEYMQTLISTARVIICGGGGTLIEAARSGTPAVVVKMADNQQNNIKAWTQLGFARYAGEKNSPDLAINAIKHLAELDNYDIWKEASEKGFSCVDGQGARRITGIILSETEGMAKSAILKENIKIGTLYLKNFLRCTSAEHELIRNAKNSPVVRAGSINQQIVTLSRHQAFILTLGTSTTGGYWLMYNGETALGVVSLVEIDWYRSQATLGYYKLPDYPGKGVGKILVSAAKDITFDRLGLNILLAECLADNIASLKSMEAAGLTNVASEERNIGGKCTVILKYETHKEGYGNYSDNRS